MSNAQREESVLDKVEQKKEDPPMYKVVLLNDDFTSFEFVIHVMQSVFGKNVEEAIQITVQIHEEGKGVCGVYTKDIAESKQRKVILMAEKEEYPLQCVVEPEKPAPKGPRL